MEGYTQISLANSSKFIGLYERDTKRTMDIESSNDGHCMTWSDGGVVIARLKYAVFVVKSDLVEYYKLG